MVTLTIFSDIIACRILHFDALKNSGIQHALYIVTSIKNYLSRDWAKVLLCDGITYPIFIINFSVLDINHINATPSSVTISWTMSSTDCPEDAQCAYIVKYRMIGKEACPEETIVDHTTSELAANGSQVTIEGLEPYTRYNISLLVQGNDTWNEIAFTIISTNATGKQN